MVGFPHEFHDEFHVPHAFSSRTGSNLCFETPASRASPCTSHGTPTCEVLSIQQEQAVPQDPCPDMLEHVGTVGILKFVSRISNWIKSAYTICIYIYIKNTICVCIYIYIHNDPVWNFKDHCSDLDVAHDV